MPVAPEAGLETIDDINLHVRQPAYVQQVWDGMMTGDHVKDSYDADSLTCASGHEGGPRPLCCLTARASLLPWLQKM